MQLKMFKNRLVVFSVLALLFALVGIVLLSNMRNVVVPAGYAGYIYTKPLFGKSSFQKVLIGQDSTGWKWRQFGALVSVTPYTYPEEFKGNAQVLAKDKLPLDARCHIVWRLRDDQTSIRSFLEKFGGWDVDADPDKIAQGAYDQFIREPLRTEARNIISKYNGLDVNSNLIEISRLISDNVDKRLEGTPFEVLDVVMGNANPPAEVIQAIANKVASEQNLQQRSVQLEIAQKNVDIQTAEGRAEGAKAAAKATEEAKAIASIKAVLSPEYIQYLQTQNIQGASRVFVPMGANVILDSRE